ncbi:MAG: quinohemoprotein amine dehydrogenase subunit alpha, partial [Candidatus Competibacterales bacterium]|nr:quinohemoprotein amine dehydrogenase subunit alpha [Candidatus Competibacterales bacterium]
MKRLDSVLAGVLALGAAALTPVAQGADDGAALLEQYCAGCHQAGDDGSPNRIDEARRTPEGWDMTLARMQFLHGVEYAPGDRAALVRHLADSRGLAPQEAAPWRYVLEQRPNVIEQPEDGTVAVMCARCHSYARVALQRRSRDDWLKLSHFHLGQYPTTEYQALGRDRYWWRIASTDIPERLAELYPLDDPAWQAWQAADKPDPTGSWRVSGHQPGRGRYTGNATILPTEGGGYTIDMALNYADGGTRRGEGQGVLYTGYEWRASLTLDDTPVRQVLALSSTGDELTGRWYQADDDALGGDLRLRRLTAAPAVLAVEPPYLQPGQQASVVIHGVGLEGSANLGEGVLVEQVLYRSPVAVTLAVRVTDEAPVGPRDLRIGEIAAPGALTVYDRIDSVRVEPGYAIARVGSNGGPIDTVPAQFDAVAYLDGPDGEPGTDDDVRIGSMPAHWAMDNA